MPHSDTNYSPFDLVYGFKVRGPLDLVYCGWTEDVCKGIAVSKWVDSLQERLGVLEDRNMARRKGKRDIERERMNRTRSDRVLSVGNQVLLKTPGRSGAFSVPGKDLTVLRKF